MCLWGDAGKRFRAISGKEPLGRKIIDGRTCLRSEKAVIYSPRFHPPTSPSTENSSRASVGKAENPTRGAVLHGPHTSGRHLADHFHHHVLFHRQDAVVTGGRLGLGRQNRSSLHNHVHPDGRCVRG